MTMWLGNSNLLIVFIIALGGAHALSNNVSDNDVAAPEFFERITNQTVAVGRDAILSCYISNLGNYRVGWVKTNNKAIQAIHDHVITHNPRVSVSHNEHVVWNLHIMNVQEEDRGQYMCQINTDPMKSQTGYLEVVIPPDIINDESSNDLTVQEGGSVKLVCKARGYPKPIITWRREDNLDIVDRDVFGDAENVIAYEGEVLKLSKISRSEMGTYLCIASNGNPPSVSKRVIVSVNFHPVIQVPNQLVGAPKGTDVYLECFVEAYPKPITYWIKDTGDMVVSNNKYEVKAVEKSLFETKLSLRVKNFHRSDEGSYKCNAKNSVGDVDSTIRLYEIPGPTKWPYNSIKTENVHEESIVPLKTNEVYHFNHELLPSSINNNNRVIQDETEVTNNYNQTVSSELNSAILPVNTIANALYCIIIYLFAF